MASERSFLVLALCLIGHVVDHSFAFAPVQVLTKKNIVVGNKWSETTSQLSAAPSKSAPQYDKIDAFLSESEVVADGSVMIRVQVPPKDGFELDYKPGHVLALEIEDKSGEYYDSDDIKARDTRNNGGWMRGPYTVSRCNGKDSFDVLIRVVGKKSKAFAESPLNTPVKFGGKFKVPILDGINKEDTKQVVLVSTGVGVGPCIGCIEMALQDDSFPPIALFASFREGSDVVSSDYMKKLSEENPTKFQWIPIITSQSGRIASSKENLEDTVLKTIQGIPSDDERSNEKQGIHFHLIGNGQMVQEWQSGLEKAGISEEKITIEQYFNSKAKPDSTAVENIASVVASARLIEVQ